MARAIAFAVIALIGVMIFCMCVYVSYGLFFD